MSTVARPHSTELQVLKGAQPSVHGTAQRVHMGQGAASSVCAWMLLYASLQSRGNAKPLLSRRCCSNEDRATHRAAGNSGSKTPHLTQSWVKWKKGPAGLAGRGPRCLGAEGEQTPELREPGAAAGSAGCPAAGRGRQTPRRRRGMLRTAPPGRHQRPEGQGRRDTAG